MYSTTIINKPQLRPPCTLSFYFIMIFFTLSTDQFIYYLYLSTYSAILKVRPVHGIPGLNLELRHFRKVIGVLSR